MNSPAQKRAQLPQYRSQVNTLTTHKSPVLVNQNQHQFKHSLVSNYTKKHQQFDKKSSNQNIISINRKYDQLLSERSPVKGYEHLLPAKGKNLIKSPLNSYRSRENLSPQTLRENIYGSDNQSQLQGNRSAKFIQKLREQINSPRQKYASPRLHKDSQLTQLTHIKFKQKTQPHVTTRINPYKHQQTVMQSRVNHTDYHYSKQLNNRNYQQLNQSQQQHYSPQTIKRQRLNQSELEEVGESPEKQSFQRRLLDKCKSLQVQLDKSEKEVARLTMKLQTAQSKHNSQVNLIKNQGMLQKSRKQSQLQIAKKQLEELQKSFKTLQKSHNLKEKTLTSQITKCAKHLKQTQQQKNKLILQFQTILRDKLSLTEKKCSDQSVKDFERLVEENKLIKKQLSQLKKQMESIKQEKEDIFEESKLLHLELENYTKWNDQQAHENRLLERKTYEIMSQNKLLIQQQQLLYTSIQELQQTLENYKTTIKSLQTTQCSLSEQVQILRFQLQSTKNQLQSRQKQFIKQKSHYLQEIQILQAKCISYSREKVQICEELDYQRKELANMRRLVDSLQERLQEERRQCQQQEITNDKYEIEIKEKSLSLAKSMQTLIYKQNQISQLTHKIQQLQEQMKLAKTQKSYSAQHCNNNHQHTIQQLNQSQPSRITQYLQRVDYLQTQITQLDLKFRQQKSNLSHEYHYKQQQMKQKLINAQKQLFRKEQGALDDRKRHMAQLTKHQQQITLLQDQLISKKNQLKHLNQQLNIKEIQLKHLTIKIHQLQSSYQSQLHSKSLQLTSVKNSLNSQRNQQLSAILKIIDHLFYMLSKELKENKFMSKNQQSIQNNRINRVNDEIPQLNQLQLTTNNRQSPENKSHRQSPINRGNKSDRQQSINKENKSHKSRQPSPTKNNSSSQSLTSNRHTFMNYLKHFNQHQLNMEITSKTKQLASSIKLLTKKVHLYQSTIQSLEESLESKPIQIHQKYIHTISELQKRIYIQENTNQMKQAQLNRHIREQKDSLLRQVQRMKLSIGLKDQEINQLIGKIQLGKKIQEELREKIEVIEKQHKKIVKKLNSDIEQYKNLVTIMKEENQQEKRTNQTHHRQTNNYSFGSNLTTTKQPLNNQSPITNYHNHNHNHNHSTLYSMTTINQQHQTRPFISANNCLPQQNTPVKPIKQQEQYITSQTHNYTNSLQQLLQLRLNELTQQNKHLNNQLSHVNSQLIKEKEMFIDQNALVKELQQQIDKMAQQNQGLREGCENIQKEHNQLIEELNYLQQHNSQLQHQITNQSSNYQQVVRQLERLKQSLRQSSKTNDQLSRQLQTLNKQQAQRYVDVKKLQDQLTIRDNQLHLVKLQKQQQDTINIKIRQQQDTANIKKNEELSMKYKQECEKRSMLQNIYHELLQWIEKQPFNHKLMGNPLNYTVPHKLIKSHHYQHLNKAQNPCPLNQYQHQTISHLTSTFTSQLSNLQHTIQQLTTLNQALKSQIHRQKSFAQQVKLDIMKKQREVQISKDKVIVLEKTIQRLEIQIQEWKFICQTTTLNKSVTLQNKWVKDSFNNRHQFTQSTITNYNQSPNKPITNIQQHPPLYPQRGTSSNTQSPLKIPPKLSPFTHQHQTSYKKQPQSINKKTDKPLLKSSQTNLQNSMDSLMSVGQFYQIQKGKHFSNDSAEMSFY